MSAELLNVQGLAAGYGSSQVLFDVSFTVKEGEFVILLGRNGMGKSTVIKALMGLIPVSAGTIQFAAQTLNGLAPHVIAQLGIGLVPEGRQIFPNLTVRENLLATAHNKQRNPNPWTLERVYRAFSRLKERASHLGGQLSGGEQQMLAIGRALMTNPRLLVLDEATEGLAPIIRSEIWQCLAELKNEGLTIICIDKNLQALLPLANMHTVIEKGRVVWQGDSSALSAQAAHLQAYLGV